MKTASADIANVTVTETTTGAVVAEMTETGATTVTGGTGATEVTETEIGDMEGTGTGDAGGMTSMAVGATMRPLLVGLVMTRMSLSRSP
jgi:hypothetical protein